MEQDIKGTRRTQNCIYWINLLSKNEIDPDDKDRLHCDSCISAWYKFLLPHISFKWVWRILCRLSKWIKEKKKFQEKQNLKKAIDKTGEINEKRMKKNYFVKFSKRRTSSVTNHPLSPENQLQSTTVRAATVPAIMIIISSHASWIPM